MQCLAFKNNYIPKIYKKGKNQNEYHWKPMAKQRTLQSIDKRKSDKTLKVCTYVYLPTYFQLIKAFLPQNQGDQMCLWENRPNCSPTKFMLKLIHNFYRGKSSLKCMWFFCNFQNIAQSYQSPNGRKFAKSGHPAQNQFSCR
jgi:replicative DNA helicase